MRYEIQIKMIDDLDCGLFHSPKERFLSAVCCARESIGSILYDYPVIVEYNDKGNILIDIDVSDLFTISELEKKIKGSFCDSNGNTYPEFDSIEIITT